MEENFEKTKWTLNGKPIRTLTADEIDCRVGQAAKDNSWFTILLYKDARVDMAMLNELVGPLGWQRDHKEIKGNLYCGVGIRDNSGEWVWKWDCGTESNTEKEKGESSDSFKRACVNWGIGYELYSSPQIFINATPADMRGSKLSPSIRVAEIEYNDEREVSFLLLVDKKGVERFRFGRKAGAAQDRAAAPASASAPQKAGLKKGQIITKEMLEAGKCDSLIGRLREFVGTAELQVKASEIYGYYKWDTTETFNAICAKAQEKKFEGMVEGFAGQMLKS